MKKMGGKAALVSMQKAEERAAARKEEARAYRTGEKRYGSDKRAAGKCGKTAGKRSEGRTDALPERSVAANKGVVNGYIEGKHPVIEALRSEVPMYHVLMADNAQASDSMIRDIKRKAAAAGVEIKLVPRAELDELSESGYHQGVMAKVKPFTYARPSEIIADALKRADEGNGSALIVVLDHVNDAGNLGAIVRSAEVVGASGVVIPNKRAASVTPTTYKTSAGAINHIKCAQVANIASLLDSLKKDGFWIAGATEHAETIAWEAPLYGKICLVMGNEQEGLARLTQDSCDFLVKLPQAGQVGSLNVAQASTALMFEWMRQCAAK